MPSFTRTTLYALFFLALATFSLATPSPAPAPSVDLAAVAASDLQERTPLVSGVEDVMRTSDLEKRGRRRSRHRKGRKQRQSRSKKASKSNAMSAKGVKHSGDATYFDVGLGACGGHNTNSDMIAAASHALYDSYPGATANPNKNPICGKRLRATYRGKSVVVKIVDRCTGCAKWALDFSPKAFNKMGKPSDGRLKGMKWEWI